VLQARSLRKGAPGRPGDRGRQTDLHSRGVNRIADRIDENLALPADVETRANGKRIRETLNADVPLAADHFRYFAGGIRAEEGTIGEIDRDTIAYHFRAKPEDRQDRLHR